MKRRPTRPQARRRRPFPRIVPIAVALAVVLAFGIRAWLRNRTATEFQAPMEYLQSAAAAAGDRGDFRASLAIIDRGLARYPHEPLLRMARGTSLNNLSFRVHLSRGRYVPGYPTSLERVRAAKAALLDFQAVADRQPGAPEPLAEVGLTLASWGLPMDGLMRLEQAYALGDRRPQVLGAIRELVEIERGARP